MFHRSIYNTSVEERHNNVCAQEFFPAGAKILRQGEKGEKFYIISGGSVQITKDTDYGGEEELVILGKGEYFGELALYDDGGERRANATALAPGVECLTLDRT